MRYLIYDDTGRVIGHMTSSAAEDDPPGAMDGQHVVVSDDGGEATHYVADGKVLDRPAAPAVAPVSGVVGVPMTLLTGAPEGTMVLLRPTGAEIAAVGGEVVYTPVFGGLFQCRVVPPWPAREAVFALTVSPAEETV
ncbi:hypothetical protein [Xanthobacter sediminis]